MEAGIELVAATGNLHKLREIRQILQPMGILVTGADALGVQVDEPETGDTFAENARIKALSIYRQTGRASVADDSGLCVDALGGRPGVHSARYGGEGSPYADKMASLLREMEHMRQDGRAARFVSAVCCVLEDGRVLECQGVCSGTIAHGPTGDGGFGYDPIFMVSSNKSFAQLTSEEKNRISHRGKALRELARMLGK